MALVNGLNITLFCIVTTCITFLLAPGAMADAEHVSKDNWDKETVPLKVPRHARKASPLANCPSFCSCSKLPNSTLIITNCQQDPSRFLDNIFEANLEVKELKICNSLLSQIPDTIYKFSNLHVLNVYNNSLTDLPWECLKKIGPLNSLLLGFNNINTLRNGTIYGFNKLVTLDVSHNRLHDIETDVFVQLNQIPHLVTIDLSFNYLTSADAWVYKLLADGRKSLFINFFQNKISHFTNFIKWKLIHSQDIAGTIILQYNNITHISDLISREIFKNEFEVLNLFKTGVATYDIRHNPFTCDCKDYRIYVYLDLVHRSDYVSNLFCYKPDHLYDRKIISIPLKDFVCDIRDQCPERCDCIYVPDQMNLTVNCDKKGSPLEELPQMLPQLKMHNDFYNLNFQGNNISILQDRVYLNQTKIANFERNRIDNISFRALYALRDVTKLNMNGNNLSRLPNGVLNISLNPDARLYFGANRWNCDCHFHETRKWMIKFKDQILDQGGLLCYLPKRFKDKNLMSLREDEMICGDPPNIALYTDLAIGTGSFIGALVIITVPIIMMFQKRLWLYRNLQWHPFERDECEGEDKEFDVFVSSSNDDGEYVEDYLVPGLEERGYLVCYHRLHFSPDRSIIDNIEHCIRASKRTLVFFTHNFQASQWCMWEFTLALQLDQNQRTNRLITILDEDVDIDRCDTTIEAYLKKYTYIERNSRYFWDNLAYALPQNRLGAEEDRNGDGEDNVQDNRELL